MGGSQSAPPTDPLRPKGRGDGAALGRLLRWEGGFEQEGVNRVQTGPNDDRLEV